MRQLPINIIGGAYEGRSRNNIQELINMYIEMDQTGGISPAELRGTPGLTSWFDPEEIEEVRGFDIFQGVLYVVIGATLYSISGSSSSGGVKTSKGTMSTSAGPVQIFNNGTVLAVCDESHIYSQSGVTLTQQIEAAYMAYQDGWFIAVVPNSGSARASTDPANWVGAPTIAAEGNPDFIVSSISDHRELILFNAKTTEVLYNTGSAVIPFARVSGGFIETGCKARNSVVKADNRVYWLDDNNHVRRLNGLQTEILTPPSISYHISTFEDTQDAIGYSYSIDGHIVYVLTFPAADITYCFDTTTNIWYKWSTGGYNNRHTSNCFIRYAGKNLVGDKSNGKIYEIDPNSRKDDTASIYRERTAQYNTNKPGNTFFEKLILEIQTATETSGNPLIMYDDTDDFGKTWSLERQSSLGTAGQYNHRVEFFALGSAKYKAIRLRITDDFFVSIQGAELYGGVGWP